MAVINIRLPDGVYDRAVAAFVAAYHKGDTPPENPERYFKRVLRGHVLEVLGNVEVEQAAQAARVASAQALADELNALADDGDGDGTP